MLAKPGETILLAWQSSQGETGLYPQAIIYDSSNTTLSTVNLTHTQQGAYTGTGTSPSSEGHYYIQFIAYEDSGHTVQSPIDEIISYDLDVRYNQMPGLGGSISSGISSEELIKLLKPIKSRLGKIELELNKKSEFNPKQDVVKLNEQIPTLDQITNITNRIVVANKVEIPKQKIYDDKFKQIESSINKIYIPEQKNYSDEFIKLTSLIDNIKLDIDLSDILVAIKAIEMPVDKSNQIIDLINIRLADVIKEVKRNKSNNTEIIRKMLMGSKDSLVKELNNKIKDLDKVEVERTRLIIQQLASLFSQLFDELKKQNADKDLINESLGFIVNKLNEAKTII